MMKFLKDEEYWRYVIQEFIWVSKWAGVFMYVIALLDALINGNFIMALLLLVSPLFLGLLPYTKGQ